MAIGCSCDRLKCCLKKNEPKKIDLNDPEFSNSTPNDRRASGRNTASPTGSKGKNCHVVTAVWNPDALPNQAPANSVQKGGRPGDQHSTPNNANIQSFATAVVAKQKQKELEEKQAQAASGIEGNLMAQGPKNPTTSWSEPLKAQLKNKIPRPTSSNSTNQLIHASDTNEY